MAKVQKFEDLEIFLSARDLCKEVYAITKDGEFHKDMRFVQQIHQDTKRKQFYRFKIQSTPYPKTLNFEL